MHLIQQHTFDIACSSQSFGKDIQSQLSRVLEKDFYPQLDLLFHKYADKNHTWRIDALHIELPDISKKYWKRDLVEKSLSQIETYLKNNRFPYQEKQASLAEDSNRFVSKNHHAQEVFFCFLKTGVILENTISKDIESIVFTIDVAPEFVKKLIAIFESDYHFLMRWLFSVPEFFKESVTKKINGFANHIEKVLSAILKSNTQQDLTIKSVVKRINKNRLQRKQWLEWMQWVYYFQKENLSKDRFFKAFIELSEAFWGITQRELKLLSQLVLNTKGEQSELITKDIQHFFQTLKKSIPLANKAIDIKDTQRVSDTKPHSKSSKGSIEADAIHYINNAGLIILHPFLKTLFDQLKLCKKDGAWKNKMSLHKAILLTQYLVKGDEEFQESDLILNKMLCGLAIENVVNVTLKISKTEKEKCNSLLEAVLEHWKVMQGSSIETLQETFLQRDAKLECVKNNDYELWVEEKGVDILLEQLPWGIGTIQTPWMAHYLTSHWS